MRIHRRPSPERGGPPFPILAAVAAVCCLFFAPPGRASIRRDAERSLANAHVLLEQLKPVRPDVFFPDEWTQAREWIGRAEREGAAGRFEPALAASREAQRRLQLLQQRWNREVPEQAWREWLDLEKTADTVRASLLAGRLPATEALEEFFCRWPDEESAAAAAFTDGRFYEMRKSVDRLARQLDGMTADPCDDLFRQAMWAEETGQTAHAREVLGRLSGMQCRATETARLARLLSERMDREPVQNLPPGRPLPAPPPRPTPPAQEKPPIASAPAPIAAPLPPAEPGNHFLSMDIWQSAWGEWDGLETLFTYLAANHITEINLNPGLNITAKNSDEAYRKFKPLVDRFRAAGVERVNFLYAELGYPLEGYARFIREHPDLGIDTLVDDSEFTDMLFDRFGENLDAVKKHGLRYAGFVTVEGFGNSGVSDKTRFWVLEHVDYPMLMSYFTCNLEEQKKWAEPYLAFADSKGKSRAVRIAILLGSKFVGRERSCEKVLDEKALQDYISGLHAWALSHPSYGGIILETNLKTPRVAVSPEPLP